MPGFERYKLEEAQEEAAQLKEKIKAGEAKDYPEAEQLIEKEKSVDKKGFKKEEEPGPGELKIERHHKWSEFTNTLRGLVTTLAERESQRMSLIEMRGLGQLAGATNQLESLVHKGKVKAEDLTNALRGVASGLKAIGEVPRHSVAREDEDSLTKVYSRLGRLRDDIDGIRRAFSGNEEAMTNTSAVFGTLIDSTERAGYFIARKRQAWREYSGR